MGREGCLSGCQLPVSLLRYVAPRGAVVLEAAGAEAVGPRGGEGRQCPVAVQTRSVAVALSSPALGDP